MPARVCVRGCMWFDVGSSSKSNFWSDQFRLGTILARRRSWVPTPAPRSAVWYSCRTGCAGSAFPCPALSNIFSFISFFFFCGGGGKAFLSFISGGGYCHLVCHHCLLLLLLLLLLFLLLLIWSYSIFIYGIFSLVGWDGEGDRRGGDAALGGRVVGGGREGKRRRRGGGGGGGPWRMSPSGLGPFLFNGMNWVATVGVPLCLHFWVFW